MKGEYLIYNWLGTEDFISPIRESGGKLPGKRFQDAVFARFMSRAPVVVTELQKLAPDVNFDHTPESLKQLDAWLEPFLDSYFKEHKKDIPYYSLPPLNERGFQRLITVFNGLDPFLISLITDCYIYYGECVRKIIPELHFEVCRGKDGRWEQICFPGLVGDIPGHSINYGTLRNILFFVAEYGRDGIDSRRIHGMFSERTSFFGFFIQCPMWVIFIYKEKYEKAKISNASVSVSQNLINFDTKCRFQHKCRFRCKMTIATQKNDDCDTLLREIT